MTRFPLGAAALCAAAAGAVPAHAQRAPDVVFIPAADADAPAPDSAPPVIAVTGHRHDRGGFSRPSGAGEYILGKDDHADVLAGTSALALVKNLPGVTFTSTDAYGLDLSDGFLLVRGFRQNELAITFEGIPLNDGSYGSVTGTAPLNVGVTGDIGAVRVAPGSARLSTFSNSGNGGEVLYALNAPSAVRQFDWIAGLGSNAATILGATLNTGQIGAHGPKVLIGVERIFKQKYTGAGTQESRHANAKITFDVPWGDVTLFGSYANSRIWGYNNTSFEMLAKLGYNGTDILYPDYARAIFINQPANADASCGAYRCGELAGLVPYDTGQQTTDIIGNITHHFRLSGALSGSVMVYGAISRSNIEFADNTTPSPSGVPFSAQVWQTRPQRHGATANLTHSGDSHTLSLGVWVETTASTSQFASFNEPAPGTGAPLRTIGPYDVYGPAFRIANAAAWHTQSLQAYVEDLIRPSAELTVRFGAKAVDFITRGGGIGADAAPNGRLVAADPLLPSVSVDWHPDPHGAVYLDLAKTTIAYRVSSRGNIGPVSSAYAADSQAVFVAAQAILRPERDWNLTLGAFHDFGAISVNLDAYYGIVLDRLLNGTSGSQFAPVRSVGVVPRSDLRGADATVVWKVVPGVSLSQSAALSSLRYRSDLILPDGRQPLSGHRQPGYPAVSLVTQLSVKRQALDAGLSSTVYLDQPFTYTNDIMVPAYWQVNAHAAWQVPHRAHRPDMTVRLDVNNLINRNQIGSVGIGGYAVSGDLQTFMRSAPRQMLLSLAAHY